MKNLTDAMSVVNRRTVYSNDFVKFFGCDVQQERNGEFMMYIQCYIGNGKIAT